MPHAVIEMKEVECASTSCRQRRAHFEKPDVGRGIQKFWVPSKAEGPFFCSIECSIYWKSESKEVNEDDLKDMYNDSCGG